MLRSLLLFLVVAASLSSCYINKNIMFKTDQDYQFAQPVIDSSNVDYRIAPNDLITVDLYTNDGSLLLEFTTSSVERQKFFNRVEISYLVDLEGYVELPVLGRQKLSGMTILEAQTFLEEEYTFQFNRPFCVVRVVNRRIIVFPGSGGDAAVVPLINQNISVVEALAMAGGIRDRGNASKVKLIRRATDGKQEVYLLDLSTIEGIQYANMAVQAGDILYVEPTADLAAEALRDIGPIVSLITGLGVIYALLRGI